MTIEIMRLIYEQGHGALAFFDQLLQFTLAALTLLGNLHLLVAG